MKRGFVITDGSMQILTLTQPVSNPNQSKGLNKIIGFIHETLGFRKKVNSEYF